MAEANATELYRKHRPTKLTDVLGQDKVIATLTTLLEGGRFPHVSLITGPSGVGKTTLARIIARKLGCSDMDLQEINCAVIQGPMETVQGIHQGMGLSPWGGKSRGYILDEVQSLSRAGFAQQALLKMLEETPEHVYFFFCTTNPEKILDTVRSRCTPFQLEPLSSDTLVKVLETVIKREGGWKGPPGVVAEIASLANGSARQALVLLGKVFGSDDPEYVSQTLKASDPQKEAIDLCRVLMNNRSKWADVTAVLNNTDKNPEELRRAVLGYAASVLLKGTNNRAYLILTAFESHFFDSGKGGLVRACFEVFQDKSTS